MRLTTNQKIAGSSPARIGSVFFQGQEGIRGQFVLEDCRIQSCQDRYVSFQGKGNKGQMEHGGSCPNGNVDFAYLRNITVKVSWARDDSSDGHVEDEPLSHDHHLHHHHKEQGQQLVHLQL